MISTRRQFITGLSALIAAPAIVRAESLMKVVVPARELVVRPNTLLTFNEMTLEAVRLLKNSKRIIELVDFWYDSEFAASAERVGSQLRIKLPKDFHP